ncbi:MAG: hypothetical protein ABID67_01970, partial [Candidatus Nealsonbacteria bacterium]
YHLSATKKISSVKDIVVWYVAPKRLWSMLAIGLNAVANLWNRKNPESYLRLIKQSLIDKKISGEIISIPAFLFLI